MNPFFVLPCKLVNFVQNTSKAGKLLVVWVSLDLLFVSVVDSFSF